MEEIIALSICCILQCTKVKRSYLIILSQNFFVFLMLSYIVEKCFWISFLWLFVRAITRVNIVGLLLNLYILFKNYCGLFSINNEKRRIYRSFIVKPQKVFVTLWYLGKNHLQCILVMPDYLEQIGMDIQLWGVLQKVFCIIGCA